MASQQFLGRRAARMSTPARYGVWRVVVAVQIGLVGGCSAPRDPNKLSSSEIASEISTHEQIIRELTDRSIDLITDAKSDLRTQQREALDLQGTRFEPDVQTKEAGDSLVRFRHSTDVTKITIEMYDELRVLDNLKAENPTVVKFQELIIQLEVAIQHNERFMDDVKRK